MPIPAHRPAGGSSFQEFSVLDLAYVIGAIALFALVALIAKGVEKL